MLFLNIDQPYPWSPHVFVFGWQSPKAQCSGQIKKKKEPENLGSGLIVIMHWSSIMVSDSVERVTAATNNGLHSNFPKRNGLFGAKQKNHSLWEGDWMRVGVYFNWLKAGI